MSLSLVLCILGMGPSGLYLLVAGCRLALEDPPGFRDGAGGLIDLRRDYGEASVTPQARRLSEGVDCTEG